MDSCEIAADKETLVRRCGRVNNVKSLTSVKMNPKELTTERMLMCLSHQPIDAKLSIKHALYLHKSLSSYLILIIQKYFLTLIL